MNVWSKNRTGSLLSGAGWICQRTCGRRGSETCRFFRTAGQCGAAPGVLAKEGEQSPTKIVRDALYYIRRHYNENISLTDVAEHINVNKSYLCDVFKKEQKVTILQYMTNLRIEKAKELLLHTDMKMYEISVEVGYNDYTYFHRSSSGIQEKPFRSSAKRQEVRNKTEKIIYIKSTHRRGNSENEQCSV